jgi:hypothetical protein
MLPVPSRRNITDNASIFEYDNTDLHAIVEGVAQFFVGRQYKLESGTSAQGVYGYGNNTLRILFGAFVKRFAFSVLITQAAPDQPVVFRLEKGISGAMGGIIGYAKMNSEYTSLINLISEGA